MDAIDLGDGIVVPDAAIDWSFTASGGPGGQHANRANTKVEARVDLTAVELPDPIRARLLDAFGNEVRVTVDDERSQARNRAIALERLEERLRAALVPKKKRRRTKPTRSAKRRRVEEKRQRGETKRLRKPPDY